MVIKTHSWAPRPILQTLVQVDWEPGPTEIVPNWARAPRKAGPAHSKVACLATDFFFLNQ